MPALVDQTITVYRGEAVTLNFTMDPVEDITTWTLYLTITRGSNKTVKVLGPMLMTIVNGAAGTFRRILTEEQLDIFPTTYRFDVWRTDEGLEQPKAIGDFIILGNSRVPPVEVI